MVLWGLGWQCQCQLKSCSLVSLRQSHMKVGYCYQTCQMICIGIMGYELQNVIEKMYWNHGLMTLKCYWKDVLEPWTDDFKMLLTKMYWNHGLRNFYKPDAHYCSVKSSQRAQSDIINFLVETSRRKLNIWNFCKNVLRLWRDNGIRFLRLTFIMNASVLEGNGTIISTSRQGLANSTSCRELKIGCHGTLGTMLEFRKKSYSFWQNIIIQFGMSLFLQTFLVLDK
jgi:hypothetical protein